VTMNVVTFFPPAPPPIRAAITLLQKTAQPIDGEDASATARRLERLSELPRPWIPASCEPELRKRLYTWLEQVACWLNDQYSWQPKTMIPPCWPWHPHIAHELAVLALQRHSAETDINPTALDNWHRYNRPLFSDRMLAQLGDGCRLGHTAWAGRPRMADYAAAKDNRRKLFAADANDD
jgi:hypothetical protein